MNNCYRAKTQLFGVSSQYVKQANLFNYNALIYGTKYGYSKDIMDRIASMNYYSYFALKSDVKLYYALNVTAINYKALAIAFILKYSEVDIQKISLLSSNQAKKFELSGSLEQALQTNKEILATEKSCLEDGIPQEQCAKATQENYEAIRAAYNMKLSTDQQMEATLMSSDQGNALLLGLSFDLAKKVNPLNSYLILHGSFKSNVTTILDMDIYQIEDITYNKLTLDEVVNKNYNYNILTCDPTSPFNSELSYYTLMDYIEQSDEL